MRPGSGGHPYHGSRGDQEGLVLSPAFFVMRLLGAAVGEHREDLPAPEPVRLEREVAAVRRPRRALVVAAAGRSGAAGSSRRGPRPRCRECPARRVDDHVAPAATSAAGCGSRWGEPAHVGALGVHHEDVRGAGPVGDEGELAAGRATRSARCRCRRGGEAPERAGDEVEHVDLGIAVLARASAPGCGRPG